MRTKIVYVLVSNGKDVFMEQLYISLVSLKTYNPNALAYVVVDGKTNDVIHKTKINILSYIDKLIVIDVPSKYSGAVSSRFLKSSLRNYISGPYLFVDTDTVIAHPLDDIDKMIEEGVDIAAVKDGHCLFKELPNYYEIMERAKKIGWDDMINDEAHFNSGVMFVADTEMTHEFYHQWHQNWVYEQKKGFYFDQLAMARTNQDMGYPIVEMDDKWNFQLYWGALRFLYSSIIVHYGGYSEDTDSYYFRKRSVFYQIKQNEGLTEEAAKHMIHPKEAYIGLTKVLGQDDMNYYRSIIHDEYVRHPERFHIYELLAKFIQKLGMIKNKFKRVK